MVATPASLEAPTLHLDLPDPEQDDLSTLEFHARLEQAWGLIALRCRPRFGADGSGRGADREKRGGEGVGFRSGSGAGNQQDPGLQPDPLAESANSLVGDGLLEESSVNNFKRAFRKPLRPIPRCK